MPPAPQTFRAPSGTSLPPRSRPNPPRRATSRHPRSARDHSHRDRTNERANTPDATSLRGSTRGAARAEHSTAPSVRDPLSRQASVSTDDGHPAALLASVGPTSDSQACFESGRPHRSHSWPCLLRRLLARRSCPQLHLDRRLGCATRVLGDESQDARSPSAGVFQSRASTASRSRRSRVTSRTAR